MRLHLACFARACFLLCAYKNLCIISIPMSIRFYQNIFFVFVCLGHSVGDTLHPFQGALCKFFLIFEPLVSALYHIFLKNKHLGHYLNSNCYKYKSNRFLYFLRPWSQRERRIATIFQYFAPNLILFEPLVSALYHIFSKTNTWGIIPNPISIRSNKIIFFVFLCLVHSASDTLQKILVDLGQI